VSERTVTLVGADGTRHTLACADEPYRLGAAAVWGVGPTAHDSRPVGDLPGERLERVRALPRTIAVPVVIIGGEAAVDDALGGLGQIIGSGADCRIIYSRPDGTTRELTARYLSGGDAVPIRHHKMPAVRVPLTFRAYQPFWRSTLGPIVVEDQTFVGEGLANAVTVDNGGDVDTWPTITITGPAENIQGVNLVTGQVWRVREVITAGQTLRIETDPRAVGVWLDDIASIGVMDPLSEMWPLRPRSNHLVLSARGDGVGGIGTFRLQWRELFDTC
jgi:hypothetical protein